MMARFPGGLRLRWWDITRGDTTVINVKYASLVAAAILGMAGSAPAAATAIAPLDYKLQQSYTITTQYDLHHGLSANTYADGGGSTNSYNVSAPGGEIVDGFLKDPLNPPLTTFIIFTSNLADEPIEGQDGHLVIGIEQSLAASLLGAGDPFETTFGDFDESALIAALTLLDTADLATSDEGYAAQMAAKDDAYALLGNFGETLAQMGGWTAADNGTMTLVSYSDPGNVGSVTTSLTRVPVTSDTPEPGTWLLMVAGFGAIGFALRSRPQSALTLG